MHYATASRTSAIAKQMDRELPLLRARDRYTPAVLDYYCVLAAAPSRAHLVVKHFEDLQKRFELDRVLRELLDNARATVRKARR